MKHVLERTLFSRTLMTVGLVAVVAHGCANPDIASKRARIAAMEQVDLQIEELTCSLFSADDCRWAAIFGPDGTEFVAVAFDPDTGEEDFSTQRFLGLDEGELLAAADSADPQKLFTPEGVRAACLWVPNCPNYVGSSSIPGRAATVPASDREVDVLNRQSQLLAFLLARLNPPDRQSDPTVATVWTDDNCTLSPDFTFTTLCCAEHDACYSRGGSSDDREACDQALCECIADNGYPVLARVYFAAVQAFGWPFFGAGAR